MLAWGHMRAALSPLAPARILPVAVLGGGITGLAAAWYLRQAGVPVVLFEAAGRCGGAIASWREEGWLHEGGPNSLLEGSDDWGALLADLGLGERRMYAADAAKHRYVLKADRAEAVPTSPGQFLASRLFSWRAKLQLAGEIFRPRGTALCDEHDETVAEFTLRRLGREFLDYAVDPLVGGVYAGDPDRLSVRHAFPRLYALERDEGSLIWGAIRRRQRTAGPAGRIFSFPEGLQELPDAMAQRLGECLRLRTRVQAVRRRSDAWEVEAEAGGATRREAFSAVVCALPAHVLAAIAFEGPAGLKSLATLASIEQPPVASVFTGYRRVDVAHSLDGFGLLVPRVEHRGILGTLFSSTLFPRRAPAGHVALTTFVGGARQPELAGRDDEGLVSLVREELAAILGARGTPAFVRVHRHARSIPQYVAGFDRFEAACLRAEGSAPGLHIGGNSRDGISLSACLASGRRLASAVRFGPAQRLDLTPLLPPRCGSLSAAASVRG